MTNSSAMRPASKSDSSDRCATLTASRTAQPTREPKSGRFGAMAKQFLDALMRSLAAPHF